MNALREQLEKATDELHKAVHQMPDLKNLGDLEDVRKAVTDIAQLYIQIHRRLPPA